MAGISRYASDALKADREFILTALHQGSWALYYASAELKNDKEVVMAAVQQDGRAGFNIQKT